MSLDLLRVSVNSPTVEVSRPTSERTRVKGSQQLTAISMQVLYKVEEYVL